jgi:hypothetical protein
MSEAPVSLSVISKQPEFTEDGEVIPGQCEPYTTGWRLRLIEDGREEVLLAGTYFELRRVQRRCTGKTSEEIRKITAESKDAIQRAAKAPPLAGDADEPTQILGLEEVRRAMQEMEAAASSGETGLYSDWFELSDHGGVRVAALRDPASEVGADDIARVLGAAFATAPGAFVVDLTKFTGGGPAHARALRDLADQARSSGRFLGISGLAGAIEKAVAEAQLTQDFDLYADVDSAVAAATEAGSLDVD